MTLQGELVLLLPGNGEFPGKILRRLSHIQTAEGIREPLLDTDHRLEISHPETCESGKPAKNRARASHSHELSTGRLRVEKRYS